MKYLTALLAATLTLSPALSSQQCERCEPESTALRNRLERGHLALANEAAVNADFSWTTEAPALKAQCLLVARVAVNGDCPPWPKGEMTIDRARNWHWINSPDNPDYARRCGKEVGKRILDAVDALPIAKGPKVNTIVLERSEVNAEGISALIVAALACQ